MQNAVLGAFPVIYGFRTECSEQFVAEGRGQQASRSAGANGWRCVAKSRHRTGARWS